jgi:hypothetical protein
VSNDRVREIEEKIADPKARWPEHSMPESMWQQLKRACVSVRENKKGQKSGLVPPRVVKANSK